MKTLLATLAIVIATAAASHAGPSWGFSLGPGVGFFFGNGGGNCAPVTYGGGYAPYPYGVPATVYQGYGTVVATPYGYQQVTVPVAPVYGYGGGPSFYYNNNNYYNGGGNCHRGGSNHNRNR